MPVRSRRLERSQAGQIPYIDRYWKLGNFLREISANLYSRHGPRGRGSGKAHEVKGLGRAQPGVPGSVFLTGTPRRKRTTASPGISVPGGVCGDAAQILRSYSSTGRWLFNIRGSISGIVIHRGDPSQEFSVLPWPAPRIQKCRKARPPCCDSGCAFSGQ